MVGIQHTDASVSLYLLRLCFSRGGELAGYSEAALVEIHDPGFDRHRGQLSGPESLPVHYTLQCAGQCVCILHYSHPGSSALPNLAWLTSCMVRTAESEFWHHVIASSYLICTKLSCTCIVFCCTVVVMYGVLECFENALLSLLLLCENLIYPNGVFT